MNELNIRQKRTIIIINIVFVVLIMIFDGLFYGLKFSSMSSDSRLIIKGVASSLFVLQCLTNFLLGRFYLNKTEKKLMFPILMLIGQILACAGDIVLGLHFITGALLFAVGHVFFAIAFFQITGFNKKDFICIGLVLAFSILFLTLYPHFDFDGIDMVIYFYAIIISCMLGKAISIALSKNEDKLLRVFILFGALLFYISDFMLVLCRFAVGHEITDFLCLLFYYPAQALLALSVLGYYLRSDIINV